MFDYKGERMPIPTLDTLAKKSEIDSLPRIWSDEPSTPNRFVDGNRQLGYAARTWVRSDSGAVYAYKGYDVQTKMHSWFADTDTKLTYNAATGEIASNGYQIATVETGLDPWRNKFAPIDVREGLTFTYTDDASIFIVGKFAFLTDIPSVPVKSVNTKTGEVTLTGADIAVSGNDQTKINVALAGKASDADVVHKSGDTMTGDLIIKNTYTTGGLILKEDSSPGSIGVYISATEIGDVNQTWYKELSKLATVAESNHEGNLASLDAQGNPTNSGIPSANMEFVDNKQSMRVGMSTQIASGKTRQLALGDYSETNADGAVAIGVRKYNGSAPTKATADSSIAIGQGAQATAEGATQIGYSSTANNKSNSLRFMDTTIVDGNGKIPTSNLDKEIVTKEELEDGVTTDEIVADGITIDGKECATKDLVGQEFDFSTTQGFMNAIAACVRAFGGTVKNNPSEQSQGGN